MEIGEIFQVGPADGKYFIFVNGRYFITTLNNGNIIYHPWTQTPQLIPRNYVRDTIQPTCKITRKVILYPDPSELDNPGFYLCIDFKKPELGKDVQVPVYPAVGETIKVLGAGGEDWYGIVQQVDYDARKTNLRWYRQTQRQGIWTIMNQEDEVHFSSVVKACQAVRVFGGYRIMP